MNYGEKNTRSKTHQRYILPGSEEVHWKLSSHNYLCKYSQTHKQLYPKSRNDSPLWYNKSNKRIKYPTRIIKGKLDQLDNEAGPKKNLHPHSNETEDPKKINQTVTQPKQQQTPGIPPITTKPKNLPPKKNGQYWKPTANPPKKILEERN